MHDEMRRRERMARWLVLAAVIVTATAGVTAGRAVPGLAAGNRSAVAVDSVADASRSGDAAIDRAQAVTIESQNFESTTFPPTGWSRVDMYAQGEGIAARYLWSRETCNVDPVRGGQASAWAVGDGSEGDLLACGAPYTKEVDSYLIYAPIDTSAYSGGLRVTLDIKLDEPREYAFLVCATKADAPGYACYGSPTQQTPWETFGPMHFPDSAGMSAAEVWIIFRDRQPDGTHFGAFVDNVVIEGLTSPISPTPTDTESPTEPVTPSATESSTAPVTPTLTATQTVTPTPTPSRTATPTHTVTLTSTPSRTATPTHTVTLTLTPTATPTHTPSPGVTPSVTASDTPTPGVTLSVTPSATFTRPPTLTPTRTVSATDTNQPPTVAVTPTATNTSGVTPTVATATPTTPGTALPPPETVTPSVTDTVPPSPTHAVTPTPEWRIFAPVVMRHSSL